MSWTNLRIGTDTGEEHPEDQVNCPFQKINYSEKRRDMK